MNTLPTELLAHILSFVDTRLLYPSCFLVSHVFYDATRNDEVWRVRSLHDLGLEEVARLEAPPEPYNSWMSFYKDNMLCWDLTQATVSEAERIEIANSTQNNRNRGHFCYPHSGHPGPGYEVPSNNPRVVSSKRPKDVVGYSSLRAKRGYHSGIHSFDFIILGTHASWVFGVGVADQHWDCRTRCYEQGYDHNYSVCAVKDSGFWDASLAHSMTAEVQAPHQNQFMSVGQRVGIVLDFDERKIYFYLDGNPMALFVMSSQTRMLWPVVTFYAEGEAVELAPPKHPYDISKFTISTE